MSKANSKIVAIVQARMGSTRLPGKVLMDVEDKPVVWWVLERLKKAKRIDEIVLAIPDTKENDILADFAKKYNYIYVRGSEEDVLSRYYKTAKDRGADIIVRITADCPFVDPEIVDKVIKTHSEEGSDYTSNVVERTYPKGLDTEVFNFDVLENAYLEAKQSHHREHVSAYFLENPEMFRLENVSAPLDLQNSNMRITVDTQEDLDFIRKIAKHFSPRKDFSSIEIINYAKH
ncbi:MAG: glycosyltransferase family protein [Parcubacteria group bacterium]|nr:glycosyltransferase family protein [Parcubacteria group bacterium]